jgi:hypothetical protein
MAKSTFRTWVVGEVVTAAQLNQQIRDNGNEIWKGTTAGDIDYYASATTKTRIGIGTQNQVLATKSGVPAWDGYIGACVSRNSPISLPNDTITTITGFNVEEYDSSGFITPTADVFTIPAGYGGLYHINVSGSISYGLVAGSPRRVEITVNGTSVGFLSLVQDTELVNVYFNVSMDKVLAAGNTVGYKCYRKDLQSIMTAYDNRMSIHMVR